MEKNKVSTPSLPPSVPPSIPPSLPLSLPLSGMQANATGRSAKSVREFLEKHYSPEAVQTREDTVLLAVKALLEVVQSGSKSMELAVRERGTQLEVHVQYIHMYMYMYIHATCLPV